MGGESSRHYEPAVDESDRAYRTTALDQLNENPKRLPRKSRPANPPSGPSSGLGMHPVLVRAYSGETEDTTTKPPAMSPRRLFPFMNPKIPASAVPASPPPPADKDFSIESILQAIEPDIRGTMNSIAEICGRSKLSLANEYGSHIAPLGEIRASQGGLVPVEEASPSEEQRADEGVVLFEDDHSLMDPGRSSHSSAFYKYSDSMRQAAPALGPSGSSGLSGRAGPDTSHSVIDAQRYNSPELVPGGLPSTRDFVSKPKNFGRDLLVTNAVSGGDDPQHGIVTPAVVSEVRLDARAHSQTTGLGTRPSSFPDAASTELPPPGDGQHMPEAIRSVLGWLKWTAHVAGPESHPQLQSAEQKLRAMLQRSAGECVTSSVA